jgi:hypothetical protein
MTVKISRNPVFVRMHAHTQLFQSPCCFRKTSAGGIPPHPQQTWLPWGGRYPSGFLYSPVFWNVVNDSNAFSSCFFEGACCIEGYATWVLRLIEPLFLTFHISSRPQADSQDSSQICESDWAAFQELLLRISVLIMPMDQNPAFVGAMGYRHTHKSAMMGRNSAAPLNPP